MTTKTKSNQAAASHPSYANPTIVEALCEIHFALPEATTWKPSLPGEFFKKIQHEFPEMEPVFEVGLQLELGAQRMAHSLLPPRQRMRFKHKTRPLLLQLGENVFTVNVLPKYPGWPQMRQDVLDAWSQAREVLNPAEVTRVGLRYINRIERQSKSQTPGDWINAGEFVPAGILKSKGAFLSRVESQMDSQNRVIVTTAEVPTEGHDAPTGIAFDIDRICERKFSVVSDKLGSEMDRLHDHVWEIFEASITPKLSRLLKGVSR